MRGAGVDRRLQPVINLATNPSFETTLGTVTARTNLCLNPRAVSGGAALTAYVGTGGAASGAYKTGSGLTSPAPDGYYRTTLSTAPTSGNWGVVGPGTTVTESAGALTVTISAWMRVSVAGSYTIFAAFQYASGSPNYPSASVTLTANTWTRVSATVTSTAGQTVTSIGADFYAPLGIESTPGATIDVTGILVEQAPSVLAYFDGTTSPDADLTALWNGSTANASTSSLKGAIPNGTRTQNSVVVASSSWSQSGASSMRVIPNSSSNDSAAILAGDNNFQTLSGEGVTFKPGHTYLVSAVCRLAAPLTGTLSTRPLSLTLYTNSVTSTSGSTQTILATAPNTAGASTLSSVFTIPANAVTAVLRAYNGASMGNGDVWWDDLMLVDITDRQTLRPAYADGSTPGWKWLGTPNASQSAGPGLHA